MLSKEVLAEPAFEIKKRGFLFVLSAPSGVGKSTLISEVIASDPTLKFSVSVTTRPKRGDEKDGENYYFKTKEDFYKLIEQNAFLEYAEVYGNFYGTLKSEVLNQLEQGEDVIMDIDPQGATLMKDRLPTDVVTIYVLPPSMEELERRIRTRNQDSEDSIRYRIAKSRNEIRFYYRYDYLVVNNQLSKAVKDIQSIIVANRKRIDRVNNLDLIIQQF